MAKKKSKLKKLLKGAALAGAAMLGAKALGRRRSIANNEAKEFGFGQMKLKDYGPFTIGTKRSQMPKENPMLTSEDYGSPIFTEASAKKGGVIVKTETGGKAVRRKKKVGIQIKGFGKARR